MFLDCSRTRHSQGHSLTGDRTLDEEGFCFQMVMTYEDKAMLKKRIMLRNVSFESKTASVRCQQPGQFEVSLTENVGGAFAVRFVHNCVIFFFKDGDHSNVLSVDEKLIRVFIREGMFDARDKSLTLASMLCLRVSQVEASNHLEKACQKIKEGGPGTSLGDFQCEYLESLRYTSVGQDGTQQYIWHFCWN